MARYHNTSTPDYDMDPIPPKPEVKSINLIDPTVATEDEYRARVQAIRDKAAAHRSNKFVSNKTFIEQSSNKKE